MKQCLIALLLLLLIGCGQEGPDPRTINRFNQEILKPKRRAMLEDPQFVLDQLELVYITKNKKNLDIPTLLAQIPKKYQFYREIYRYLLLQDSSGLKANNKTFEFLLNYQGDKHVQKLFATRFAEKDSRAVLRAYFLLYALDYPFSEKEEQGFIKRSKVIEEFIELNEMVAAESTPINKELTLENKDLEQYLKRLLFSYTEQEISDLKSFQKKIYSDYRSGKKELVQLKRKIGKLKRRRKDVTELTEQLEQLTEQQKRIAGLFAPISDILYFHGVGKRHKINDPEWFFRELIKHRTAITPRMAYYLSRTFKKKPYPIRLTFYRYLFTRVPVEKHRSLKKLFNSLLYHKQYAFLKYGYFKRHLPERFKTLNLKAYRKELLLLPAVKATHKDHLSRLLNNKFDMNRLNIFRFVPEKLSQGYFDSLFELYIKERNRKGELYVLITIALRGKKVLTPEQIQKIQHFKLLYFEELLGYF